MCYKPVNRSKGKLLDPKWFATLIIGSYLMTHGAKNEMDLLIANKKVAKWVIVTLQNNHYITGWNICGFRIFNQGFWTLWLVHTVSMFNKSYFWPPPSLATPFFHFSWRILSKLLHPPIAPKDTGYRERPWRPFSLPRRFSIEWLWCWPFKTALKISYYWIIRKHYKPSTDWGIFVSLWQRFFDIFLPYLKISAISIV